MQSHLTYLIALLQNLSGVFFLTGLEEETVWQWGDNRKTLTGRHVARYDAATIVQVMLQPNASECMRESCDRVGFEGTRAAWSIEDYG